MGFVNYSILFRVMIQIVFRIITRGKQAEPFKRNGVLVGTKNICFFHSFERRAFD